MLALVAKPIGTGSSTVDSSNCLVIILPQDDVLRAAIYGAISILGYEEYWYELGTLTPEETANYFAEKINTALLAISVC